MEEGEKQMEETKKSKRRKEAKAEEEENLIENVQQAVNT